MTNALPVNDIDGFIAHAKANPGAISYATLGAASAQEIFVRQLERLAGISLNRVPFRTGPQIMPDLIAGRVHIYVSPTLAVLPLHDSKELKVIGDHQPGAAARARRTSRRSTEKKIPFVRFGWLGICAREGTPQPIIAELNRHIAAIVAIARIPGADRERRLDPGIVDAGRARQDHRPDPRRGRLDHRGIRIAAGLIRHKHTGGTDHDDQAHA